MNRSAMLGVTALREDRQILGSEMRNEVTPLREPGVGVVLRERAIVDLFQPKQVAVYGLRPVDGTGFEPELSIRHASIVPAISTVAWGLAA